MFRVGEVRDRRGAWGLGREEVGHSRDDVREEVHVTAKATVDPPG